MGTPAFPDLGKHCSVTSCQQIDFLPFTCDKCRMVFCLSHRMPASHECPRATVGDAVVLLCPLCAKAVRLVGDEDPNVTWARHERVPTDAGLQHGVARKCPFPANIVTPQPPTFPSPHLHTTLFPPWVANKRRCAAQGCKEVLSPANTVTCRDCSRQTCLRHRFGADHACSGSQKNLQPVSFWAAGGAYSEKLMAGVQGAMAGLMAPAGGAAGAGSSSGVGGSGAGKSAGQAGSAAGSQSRVGSAEPQQPGAGAARAGGGDGGGGPEGQREAEAVQVGRVVAKGLSNAQDAGNVFPTLLVYYCCRLCQMQAWRKHRHVCGAAAAAAARIQRTRALLTPSQWRALGEFGDAVRALIPAHLLVPTQPDLVASALLKIAAYVRQRPHLVQQPMADAVWAAALSMRGEGASPRLYMAWAWGFLEAAVESGSVDAFLAALRIDPAVGGAADLPRVNRWMKRGLCQALLMLNKRQEVGAFFRHAPRQQLLYF
ncbi:unnamed protein product [Closterium sp. Naga37s-1]|nr:unnamed protein product [Closterium sp. Naga37s-1]CAI5495397.1 unnamed protein product [Closterium sp. Naga37s-1]